MSAKSDYLENAMINAVLRNIPFTSPTTVYVGLFTSDPGEAAGGTEVSGGAYARKEVTFGAPSNGTGLNSANITFVTATANWGTITHMAIFDALTGGNKLYYGPLTVSKTINSGDVFEFPIGQLTVTEA